MNGAAIQQPFVNCQLLKEGSRVATAFYCKQNILIVAKRSAK